MTIATGVRSTLHGNVERGDTARANDGGKDQASTLALPSPSVPETTQTNVEDPGAQALAVPERSNRGRAESRDAAAHRDEPVEPDPSATSRIRDMEAQIKDLVTWKEFSIIRVNALEEHHQDNLDERSKINRRLDDIVQGSEERFQEDVAARQKIISRLDLLEQHLMQSATRP